MPQQINFPYGNAYVVGTPAIDRMAAFLGQEQKQRDFVRQKQQQALDDEFSKNVAGIRDADVPELTKVYGDWKLANQQAMKKKDGVSPEEQLQLLRKKGEMYKLIAASKAGLAEEEDIRKDGQKNPDNYDDNYSTYLAVRRKTPLSKLSDYTDDKGNKVNLADFNTFRYKGSDTDFQKILTSAAGQPKQVNQKEETLDGGLQYKITPYMYGNTPGQYYESLVGSLGDRKASRSAAALASNITPEMYSTVNDLYMKIPAEKWKRMGVNAPQEIIVKPDDTPAIKYAKHQAQLYALNNEPKEGTPVFRDNKKAIDDQNFEQQKKMAAINHAYNLSEKDYAQSLKDAGDKNADLWIDKHIVNLVNKAREQGGSTVEYKGANGQNFTGRLIQIDPILSKAVGFTDKDNGQIIITDDGKFIVNHYKTNNNYEPIKNKDGSFQIVPTKTAVLEPSQLKLALGGKTGMKQLNKEMSAGTKPIASTKAPSASTSTIPSATKAEWKAAGWTDDQINKAIKSGKIVVK